MGSWRFSQWLVVLVGGAVIGVGAFTVFGPAPSRAEMVDRTASPSTSPPTSPPSLQPEPATTVAAGSATTLGAGTRGPLAIQGVGDVNFDPSYITDFATVGYGAAFAGLDGAFRRDDLTVVNMECPPTVKGYQADKQYSFRCDPAALPIAAEFGVEVANLANNHSQDRGTEGLLDSIRNLRRAGIAPVGVGKNLADATKPAVFEVNGWKVAVLGMGGIVPSDQWLAGPDQPGMASGDDVEQMVGAVENAKKRADVVVVAIHWGTELVTEPSADDRARAEAMIAAGADVIFGHHPHRLGELELIDGKPVFWTLGNFIWPRLSDEGATTAIGRVEIDSDGVMVACLVPAFIEQSGRPVLRGVDACAAGR
jgi:poly-gamma-glutamate synthesis protein (capsule biosynthesis protein)